MVLIGMISILSAWILSTRQQSLPPSSSKVQSIPAGNSFDIKGFRYQAVVDGHRLFAVKADRFYVQKKKLGFIRIGLFNEIRILNAVIQIFETPEKLQQIIENRRDPHRRPNTKVSNPGSRSQPPSSNFTKLLTTSGIKLPKNIAGFVASPISLSIRQPDMTWIRISADRAEIGKQAQYIVFSGNVHMHSGKRNLRTDRLELSADMAHVSTDRSFVLLKPDGPTMGRRFLSDLSLYRRLE